MQFNLGGSFDIELIYSPQVIYYIPSLPFIKGYLDISRRRQMCLEATQIRNTYGYKRKNAS